MPLCRTLLIANRGEIACRIIKTAARLGIRTVAVHTAADAHALHRRAADSAVFISDYLDGSALIDAARSAGADALHPGSGFLSESAAFAEQCAAAGITFVGPSPAAMRQAGSKAAARQLAAASGIATVPGFDTIEDEGSGADDATLAQAAADIGTPLLIKAAGGGGGRGMRVVDDLAAFPDALAQARREASAGFGDPRVILEKYVRRARHIEAQLLADQHGSIVVLGERDCSLQRRYQKVIEEAPAPNLSDEQRAQIRDSVRRLAAAIAYSNAGTVEFLLDAADGALYFLEINARLQVEHPVTELIYGIDLVEWQLRIAAGEHLPTDGWRQQGAAIEVRLCAEEPLNEFLPASGRLTCRFPNPSSAPPVIRIDSGIDIARGSDIVGDRYDSLFAKLIVAGGSRDSAIAALTRALGDTEISGVGNNVAFARHLLQTAAFQNATCWTTMIEETRADWSDALLAQQATLVLLAAAATLPPPTAAFADAGLRLNAAAQTHCSWMAATHRYDLSLQQDDVDSNTITIQWQRDDDAQQHTILSNVHIAGSAEQAQISATIDGVNHNAKVWRDNNGWHVAGGGMALTLTPPPVGGGDAQSADKNAIAPMNAVVGNVRVAAGDKVQQGDALVTLEAMKMEIQLVANIAGSVAAIHCAAGDRVSAGAILVELVEIDDESVE